MATKGRLDGLAKVYILTLVQFKMQCDGLGMIRLWMNQTSCCRWKEKIIIPWCHNLTTCNDYTWNDRAYQILNEEKQNWVLVEWLDKHVQSNRQHTLRFH